MTTLSVHGYDSPGTAERRIGPLEPGLGRRVTADDIAVITWPDGSGRPVARHAALLGANPLSGAFWGLLFAHLFLMPVSYAQPPRIDLGESDQALAPLGLTGNHVSAIRSVVTSGTSAVFTLHADDVAEAIAAVLRCDDRRRIEIGLDARQSRRLLAGFREDQA